MSAETLRKAAALMRERAEAAPKQPRTDADVVGVWLHSRHHLTIPRDVALAVADWLDAQAARVLPRRWCRPMGLGNGLEAKGPGMSAERAERYRHHKPPAARHWPRDPDDLNTHPGVDPEKCDRCAAEKEKS